MPATGYERWRAACWLGLAIGALGILVGGDRLVLALAPAGLLLAGCGVAALRDEALRGEIGARSETSALWRWRFGRVQAALLLLVGVIWALLGLAEGL